LGVELFSTKELQSGVILLNFGSKKTSLGLFKNLALIHSITFPIGTEHIINDLSKVCSLETEESSKIKDSFNFIFENNQNLFDENNFLKKEFFINSKYRKISKSLIFNIIRARLDEIFEMTKKQLIHTGFNFNSRAGIFLTGEGSDLKNIERYCQNFLKLNTKIRNEKNLEKNFLACFGGIRIISEGWETEAIPETKVKSIEKIGFLRKIFGNN